MQSISATYQPTTASKVYKDNLIARIASALDFEMTVIEVCDRLMRDENFPESFRRSGSQMLLFQRELLDAAFLMEPSPDDDNAAQIARKRALCNCRTIAMYDLTEVHFDFMKDHFVEALRHSWVNDEDIQIVTKYLESIRCIFTENASQVTRQNSNSTSVLEHKPLSPKDPRGGHRRTDLRPRSVAKNVKQHFRS